MSKLMLIGLIVGIYGFGISAIAEDSTSDSASTQLQNLVYYPHKGQFLLTPTITASLQDGNKVYNDVQVQTSYSNTSTENISATLAYGVFDRFRIALAETWLITDLSSSTNMASGNVTTASTQGPSDPTLTATYRYVEPNQWDGIHADVSFNIVPSIGTKDAATAGQTGSDNGGAWNSSISVPTYWVYGRNELGGDLTLTHYFGGTANGTMPSNTTLTEPYWQETLVLEDRYHFTNSFYLQPEVIFYLPYSYDSATQTSAETSHEVGFYMSPEINLGYLISPRSLIDFTLQYVSQTSNSYPANGKNTETDTTEFLANVQAKFLF